MLSRRQPWKPFGQARPEVPRWRRGTPTKATRGGDGWSRMSRRRARTVGREMGAGLAAELGGTLTPAPGAGVLAGVPVQPRRLSTSTGVLASGREHRTRYQVAPFAVLALVFAEGTGAHYLTPRPLVSGAVIAAVTAVLLWRFTCHLSTFARWHCLAMAALTLVFVPAIAHWGLPGWLTVTILAAWALGILYRWVRHYAWHPGPPATEPQADTSDVATWARLAAKRHWAAWLGAPERILGGVRYPITCDGTDTDIGEIVSQPKRIAAAFGKSTGEAYAERHPTGAEHRGHLTLLARSTLEDACHWDRRGVNPDTGLARIGRYADATPAHIRLLARMDGIRHGIIAGCLGSGKTEVLELLIRIALASPFPIVPVILDAQMGQSLPEWREHLIYASGPDECIKTLRWLHAGMLDRSLELGRLQWEDDTGAVRKGMGFYDPFLASLPALTAFTGAPAGAEQLPVVLAIGDEFPVLLTHDKYGDEAVHLAGGIGKLGRKTGFALWPVAQVPSLSELGDQALRSMLVGCNVICLRTGDSVSAGMLGIPADPSELPLQFPGGQPTYGLGYLTGPDNRQAEFRTDLTPDAVKRTHPDAPPLDSRLAAIAAGWRREPRTGLLAPRLPPDAPKLAAVPSPEVGPAPVSGQDDGPAGRSAADCILAVLRAGYPDPQSRGDLLNRCADLATGKEWGRKTPFSVRGITDRLSKLVDAGQVERLDGGDGYRLIPPSASVPAEPAPQPDSPPALTVARDPGKVYGPGEITTDDLVMMVATWGLRCQSTTEAAEHARGLGMPEPVIAAAMELLTNDRDHVIAGARRVLTEAGAPIPAWLPAPAPAAAGTAGGHGGISEAVQSAPVKAAGTEF